MSVDCLNPVPESLGWISHGVQGQTDEFVLAASATPAAEAYEGLDGIYDHTAVHPKTA